METIIIILFLLHPVLLTISFGFRNILNEKLEKINDDIKVLKIQRTNLLKDINDFKRILSEGRIAFLLYGYPIELFNNGIYEKNNSAKYLYKDEGKIYYASPKLFYFYKYKKRYELLRAMFKNKKVYKDVLKFPYNYEEFEEIYWSDESISKYDKWFVYVIEYIKEK